MMNDIKLNHQFDVSLGTGPDVKRTSFPGAKVKADRDDNGNVILTANNGAQKLQLHLPEPMARALLNPKILGALS